MSAMAGKVRQTRQTILLARSRAKRLDMFCLLSLRRRSPGAAPLYTRNSVSFSLGKEDQERDQQCEQRDGFRQREAQNADREDLRAGGRVAGNRSDQRREDVADTDTDT